jgi:CHAD domain-containing protein
MTTWEPDSSAHDNAVRELPKLARRYFKAGRKAVKGRKSPPELHRFRVATKQFRYALEIFRPLYGAELEPQLERLHELQKLLGKISDSYTIRELLKADKELKKELGDKTRKNIAEFRAYWRDSFDAPGQRTAWLTLLSGAAKPVEEPVASTA